MVYTSTCHESIPMFIFHKGFTLIDVVIATVVVTILVTVALPGLQHQVRTARRLDGIESLLALQRAQERFRLRHARYGRLEELEPFGVRPVSTQGYYRLALPQVGNGAYIAQAVGQGPQHKDRAGGVACGVLTLSMPGMRRHQPLECWPR